MKYILFSMALVGGFAITLNAQDSDRVGTPNLNTDHSGVYSGKAPVPMLKNNKDGKAPTTTESTKDCFERNAFRRLEKDQKCEISDQEKTPTILTRTEVKTTDGKIIRGWKVKTDRGSDINGFQDYIWLEYDPGSLNKNAQVSQKICADKGGTLPTYEELSAIAETGFLKITTDQYFDDLNPTQLSNVRFRSKSTTPDLKHSLSRKASTNAKDPDPLAKVNTLGGVNKNFSTQGYDTSLCVVKNK